MAVRVGIDIGGTFTDVVAVDSDSGHYHYLKVATEVDPADSFLTGLSRIRGDHPGHQASIEAVLHGTTVATNIILQRSGARTALVTTAGFLHVLEIGRHDVPRGVSPYAWEKPRRPVEACDIVEIEERIGPDGTCLKPLTREALEAMLKELEALEPEAVAVCLLHSYANAQHEVEIRDLLQHRLPGVPVSLSSEVLPVFREFERTMATVLNSYVTPSVQRYVERVESLVRQTSTSTPLLIMKSNGGLIKPNEIARSAFQTALSGPAAGAVGAAMIASVASHPNAISMDVGGTSTDICVIRSGAYSITSEGTIGELPCHTPMVDIHTIGAGGGSLAYISQTGNLLVGPRSAGANPGPACYGRGGIEPTVTDANLVLGRLPGELLGGEFPIDREAAVRALERIAGPTKLSVEEVAEGVISLLVNNMAQAIRSISIERGLDPREFCLVPFGGAGPLHACRVAQALDIDTVIVPMMPGVLSALGLLATDLKNDYARTCFVRGPDYDLDALAAALMELRGRATAWLEENGADEAAASIVYRLDARYPGQQHEVTVDLVSDSVSTESLRQVKVSFHDAHERLYGHSHREKEIEIVTVRVACAVSLPKPKLTELQEDAPDAPPASPQRFRQVYLGKEAGYQDVPVYQRASLNTTSVVQGPAIIDQVDTTTVVEGGFTARVDRIGNLFVKRQAGLDNDALSFTGFEAASETAMAASSNGDHGRRVR